MAGQNKVEHYFRSLGLWGETIKAGPCDLPAGFILPSNGRIINSLPTL